MNDVTSKSITLKLNKQWMPMEHQLVSKSICDLLTGVVYALDIVYATNPDGTTDFSTHEYVNPVTWDEWIKLPIREYDFAIHSMNLVIRAPTVVIVKRYDKIRTKAFKGKPTKQGLYHRDGGRDAYTGKEMDIEDLCIDHVHPKAKGGTDTYDNTVLTTKEINNKKGSKLNSEAGLTLHVTPHTPKEVVVSATIKKARHRDWSLFLGKH